MGATLGRVKAVVFCKAQKWHLVFYCICVSFLFPEMAGEGGDYTHLKSATNVVDNDE